MAEPIKREQNSSAASLLSEIIQDTRKLARQELELARVEFKEDWSKGKAALLAFGTASTLRTLAILHLSLAIVFCLVELLEWKVWVSFAVTSLVSGAIALITYRGARRRIDDIDLIPRKTVQSIKENAEWIKTRM